MSAPKQYLWNVEKVLLLLMGSHEILIGLTLEKKKKNSLTPPPPHKSKYLAKDSVSVFLQTRFGD